MNINTLFYQKNHSTKLKQYIRFFNLQQQKHYLISKHWLCDMIEKVSENTCLLLLLTFNAQDKLEQRYIVEIIFLITKNASACFG